MSWLKTIISKWERRKKNSKKMTNWIRLLFIQAVSLLGEILLELKEINKTTKENLAVDKQILNELLPPPPVAMVMTITTNTSLDESKKGEVPMSVKTGKMKLTFNSDGSATATLGLVDDRGLLTTLPSGASIAVPWVSSDPGLILTPSADNLSCQIGVAPTLPGPITGATVTAGPGVITNADGSAGATLPAVVSEALNVVAGGPSGFTIQVAQN